MNDTQEAATAAQTPSSPGGCAPADGSGLVAGAVYWYAFADGPKAVIYDGLIDVQGYPLPFFTHHYDTGIIRRYLDPIHAHQTLDAAVCAIREHERIRRRHMDRMLGQNDGAQRTGAGGQTP